MLSAWNSYYVMIGSSAAALTGLMFVVITLSTDKDAGASEEGVATFSTPTVLHFCSALFVSALMCVPMHSMVPFAIVLGVAGVVGMLYVVRIARRTTALQNYRLDTEDWLWNVLLPFVAYATIAASAVEMHAFPDRALYAPAAAVLILIFVGIHNAWDVVTFLAMGKHRDP